jgi:hypothetical protein
MIMLLVACFETNKGVCVFAKSILFQSQQQRSHWSIINQICFRKGHCKHKQIRAMYNVEAF